MNKKNLIRLQVFLILTIVFLSGLTLPVTAAVNIPGSPNREMIAQAISETVQINMILPAQNETVGGKTIMVTSLGSLMKMGGEVVLVTHNHFGDALQDQSQIEFYDAKNHLLGGTNGSQFKHLIIYQDAGTLILQAPHELMDPRKTYYVMGNSDRVDPGEVVYLVHREPGKEAKLLVLEASIETVSVHAGLHVYQLRSLDGEPIRRGDSGGGVWQNGQLIGNLWETIMVEKGTKNLPHTWLWQSSDESIAAVAPWVDSTDAPSSMNKQLR